MKRKRDIAIHAAVLIVSTVKISVSAVRAVIQIFNVDRGERTPQKNKRAAISQSVNIFPTPDADIYLNAESADLLGYELCYFLVNHIIGCGIKVKFALEPILFHDPVSVSIEAAAIL